METTSVQKCRGFINRTVISGFIITNFPPFLGKLTMLSILSAFLYGCIPIVEPSAAEQAGCTTKMLLDSSHEKIRTLDIFVFRNDRMQKLDCYQRFDDMDKWRNAIISSTGERIVTAIANSPYEKNDWIMLNSRSFLEGIILKLEEDSRDMTYMSAEAEVHAGKYGLEGRGTLVMRPYSSEIVLNSISCDFTGKPYAGEKITEAKVYLTNVNAECGLLDNDEAPPRRIINSGGLCEDDLADFKDESIVIRDIGTDIGKIPLHPDIRLRCYQSNRPEETPGTPYTRLVIEGKISGRTYYWPININRDTENEAGVWRNRRYMYDIKIRRKGSSDPDKPVSTSEINIIQEIKEWEEIQEYEVSF